MPIIPFFPEQRRKYTNGGVPHRVFPKMNHGRLCRKQNLGQHDHALLTKRALKHNCGSTSSPNVAEPAHRELLLHSQRRPLSSTGSRACARPIPKLWEPSPKAVPFPELICWAAHTGTFFQGWWVQLMISRAWLGVTCLCSLSSNCVLRQLSKTALSVRGVCWGEREQRVIGLAAPTCLSYR